MDDSDREYDFLDQQTLIAARDAMLKLEALRPILFDFAQGEVAAVVAEEGDVDSPLSRIYDDTTAVLTNWTKRGIGNDGNGVGARGGGNLQSDDISFSSLLMEELESAFINFDKEIFIEVLDGCDRALELGVLNDLDNLMRTYGGHESIKVSLQDSNAASAMRTFIKEEIENKIKDMREILKIDDIMWTENQNVAEGNRKAWLNFQKCLVEMHKPEGSGSRRARVTKCVAVREFRQQLRFTAYALLRWLADAPTIENAKEEGAEFSSSSVEIEVEGERIALRADMQSLFNKAPEMENFLKLWLSFTREKTLRLVGVVLSRYLAARTLRSEKEKKEKKGDDKLGLEDYRKHLWRYQKALFTNFYHLLNEILASKIRYDSKLLIEEQHPHISADREKPLRKLEEKEDHTLLQIVRNQVDVNMGWVQFGGSLISLFLSILIPFLALVWEYFSDGKRVLWPASYKIYAYVLAMFIEISHSVFKIICVELQRHGDNSLSSSSNDFTDGINPEDGPDEKRERIAISQRFLGPPRGAGASGSGGGWIQRLMRQSVHDYYDVASEHYEERLREFILFALGEAVIMLLLPYYKPDDVGVMARKVYAVEITACCLLFMLAYLYYHVKTLEDEDSTPDEDKELELEPMSRFLSRWLHLVLSLCIFFIASSLGLMYRGILPPHGGPPPGQEGEISGHRFLAGSSSSSSGKFDKKPLVDGRAVLATSIGTFVLVITALRSLYTHVSDSKKIFRRMQVCNTCHHIRASPSEEWLTHHKNLCNCAKASVLSRKGNIQPSTLASVVPDTHPEFRLQPGKSRKLATKLAKVLFAVLHFSVGFANIKEVNINILVHFILLAVSAVTGGKSPWIFNAFKYLREGKGAFDGKVKDWGVRMRNSAHLSKNCNHCGIKRGIKFCPECHAKEAPEKQGRRMRGAITQSTLAKASIARLGDLNLALSTPSQNNTQNPLQQPPQRISVGVPRRGDDGFSVDQIYGEPQVELLDGTNSLGNKRPTTTRL